MTYEELMKDEFRTIEIEYNNETIIITKEQMTEPFWNFLMKLNVKINNHVKK